MYPPNYASFRLIYINYSSTAWLQCSYERGFEKAGRGKNLQLIKS